MCIQYDNHRKVILRVLVITMLTALAVEAKPVSSQRSTSQVDSFQLPDEFRDINTLKQQAAQSNTQAQFILGMAYASGSNVQQSFEKSVFWFKKAAMTKYPPALFELGNLIHQGLGAAADKTKAFEYWTEAARAGHMLAQSRIADVYAFEIMTETAWKKAAHWYKRAAEQHYAPAQFNYGVLYEHGRGVPKNMQTAISWWQKAANQGYPFAQHNLGVMYEEGRHVKQSYFNAVRLYRLAAEQGFSRSANRLGVLYELGTGVNKNYQSAYLWYTLAAESGIPVAKQNLARIKEALSIENERRAKAAVEEWRLRH